jgi:hypothetical protein
MSALNVLSRDTLADVTAAYNQYGILVLQYFPPST